MGYEIRYGATMVRTPLVDKKPKALTIVIGLLTVIIIFVFLGNAVDLRQYILPGNPEVTGAALNTLASDIKEGESLGSAITAFCREIIEHANIPQ